MTSESWALTHPAGTCAGLALHEQLNARMLAPLALKPSFAAAHPYYCSMTGQHEKNPDTSPAEEAPSLHSRTVTQGEQRRTQR